MFSSIETLDRNKGTGALVADLKRLEKATGFYRWRTGGTSFIDLNTLPPIFHEISDELARRNPRRRNRAITRLGMD